MFIKINEIILIVIVYFDGASSGNPGMMGIGVVLYSGGKKVAEISKSVGVGTNNEAEYLAAIKGVEEAKRRGAKKVVLKGDSLLVIRQLAGEYKIKAPHLKKLYVRFWEVAKGLDVAFVHIDRGENVADRLAKRAARRKRSFPRPFNDL